MNAPAPRARAHLPPVSQALAETPKPVNGTKPRRLGVLGWDGIPRRSGIIDADHNPALQRGGWRGDSSVMGEGKRMWLEDGEIRSSISSLLNPHLVNPWHMKPADSADPIARMIAGAAEDMIIRAPTWRKNLWDALLCVRDGVRLQEKEVYFDPAATAYAWAQEGGKVKRWVRQATGRQGLYQVRLHPRLPHTVQEWKTNPDGSFGGILQTWRDDDTGTYDQALIEEHRLLRWTHGEEGNNWEGDAIIRPAWGPCNLRRDMLNDFGVMVYRYAYGTPGFEEVEPDLDLDDEALGRLDVIAREYAADPHQFIRTPYGVKFTIHEAEMRPGEFFWKLYDGMGRAIHRLTGTMHTFSGEGYGSRSEFEAKFDAMLLNVANLGQMFAGPMNEMLADWTDLNGWDRRLAPTLEHDDLQTKSPTELAKMIKTAREAKLLTEQPDDEVMFRQAGSLPDLIETDEDLDDDPVVDDDTDDQAEEPAAPAQDSALNGAQVTAAVQIVEKVATGMLPKTTAHAMLREFFNLTDAQATAILADVEEPEEEPVEEVVTDPDLPPSDDDDEVGDEPPADDDDDDDQAALTHHHDEVAATTALAQLTGRAHRPHPGREAALRHAAQFGPLHALAEGYFSANGNRVSREERIVATAEGLGPIVRRIAEGYAERVAGKTIGEAAKEKVRPTDLVELRRFLGRQYRAELRGAREAVKGEVRAQKEDPDFVSKLADALEAVRAEGADPMAFATIGDKAGGGTGAQWEQLDIEDYIAGQVKTTADALGQDVERIARNTVQSQAAQGGATAQQVITGVQQALPLSKIIARVQPDIQGAHSTGRRLQLAVSKVPWSVYTNTPELSSEVCEVCIDVAASPDNPYKTGSAVEANFPTPNPDCLGNLAGDGNRCWCVTIGLMREPDDADEIRDLARGDV